MKYIKIAAALLSSVIAFSGVAFIPAESDPIVTAASAAASSKLAAPKNIKVTSTDISASVTWDAVEGADGYTVYLSTDGYDFDAYKKVSANNCKITGLDSYSKYYVKIVTLKRVKGKGVEQNGTGKFEIETKPKIEELAINKSMLSMINYTETKTTAMGENGDTEWVYRYGSYIRVYKRERCTYYTRKGYAYYNGVKCISNAVSYYVPSKDVEYAVKWYLKMPVSFEVFESEIIPMIRKEYGNESEVSTDGTHYRWNEVTSSGARTSTKNDATYDEKGGFCVIEFNF